MPTNTPTNTSCPQATTTALRAAQPHPMASLLTALPAASKHTPRIPVNLSVRAGHGTPATLTAPANQKSRPPDTANTEKHVTTLSRASLGTHTTAALVGAAVAHLQPTQQQRKHANWVRNGLTAGLGAADGTHRVDRPRAHQHQPSPSPDARGARPTCRSRNSAQTLPHAPTTTQTQQKKHPSPPAPTGGSSAIISIFASLSDSVLRHFNLGT